MADGLVSPFCGGVIFSAARLLPISFSFAYLLGLGLTAQDVGLARLVQLIALVLLEVPAGVVADRWGPRVAVAAATFSSAVWLACMSLVSDLPTLIAAELANAVSLALFSGAFEVLLGDTHRKPNPIARFAKTQALWIAASSVLGALLATAVSRQFAWVAAAVIQTVLLLLLVGGLRGHPRPDGRRAAEPHPGTSVGGLVAARAIPRALLVRVTLTVLAYELVLQFWQPLVLLAGLPPEDNLLLLGVSLGVMFAMSAAGGFEERRRSRLVLPAVAVVLAVATAVIWHGTHDVVAIAAWVPAGIFTATAFRVRTTAVLVDAVRGEHAIALFSLTSVVARVVTAGAVFAYGSLVTRTGDLLLLVAVLAGLLAASSLVSRTPRPLLTSAEEK